MLLLNVLQLNFLAKGVNVIRRVMNDACVLYDCIYWSVEPFGKPLIVLVIDSHKLMTHVLALHDGDM